MAEATRSSRNLKWVAIIVLLLIGIDGLLARLLEGFWDSLRQGNSPAYLPMQWWMSAPFTLFLFAILSALLTSFSGFREWLRTFLLLWGFKVIFAVVTAACLHFRMHIGIISAGNHAMFLSLPSVLVHILLSALAVMFLRDALAGKPAEEVIPSPYFAEMELEEPAPKPRPETAPVRVEVWPPEKRAPGGMLALPVKNLLSSFPQGELAMSPQKIEELSPTLDIPLEAILPQLPEGKVEVDALTVIREMPPGTFKGPIEEVAGRFPNGKIELPLNDVVSRVPPETLQPPQQESQPAVNHEYADLFEDVGVAAADQLAEEAAAALEEPPQEEAAPLEEVSPAAEVVSEEGSVLTAEERLLMERSRDVVELNAESIISQFPEGAVRPSGEWEGRDSLPDAAQEARRLPETMVVPLELILPQLARGEVRLGAKYILVQFPKGCLSISEEQIIRSLPNGEVELPLREIVPQLPARVLAPPQQRPQPAVEDMPDPFREVEHPQPVAGVEGEPSEVSERAALLEEPEEEVAPQAVSAAAAEDKEAAASYAEMLREENPLALSIDTVVSLLPEDAFGASVDELKRRLGGETLKLPRSMVMAQLGEGSIAVPVEILTAQFPREDLRMSPEQIKASFTEGVVELPLPEIVGQVLEEISRPPANQGLQPECEEISTIFHETAQKTPVSELQRPAVPGKEAELVSSEAAKAAQPSAGDVSAGVEAVEEQPSVERVIPRPEEGPAGKATTIVQNIVQKCRGLGFSEHQWFAAGDYSVVLLASSGLDREAAACEMAGIMAQMRVFCDEYSLGTPLKLVISSSGGAAVGGELVRGQPARLIVLASANKSGAGLMSLVLDRLAPHLGELSSLAESGSEIPARTCGGFTQQGTGLQLKKVPLKPDGEFEELSPEVAGGLAELGMQDYLSASTPSGYRLVVVGEALPGAAAGVPERAENRVASPAGGSFPSVGGYALGEGIFDIDVLLRYCSDVGLGTFESLLLVTQQAKVTLNKSSAGRPAYVLCFFPACHGEGLVRARARKALKTLHG